MEERDTGIWGKRDRGGGRVCAIEAERVRGRGGQRQEGLGLRTKGVGRRGWRVAALETQVSSNPSLDTNCSVSDFLDQCESELSRNSRSKRSSVWFNPEGWCSR